MKAFLCSLGVPVLLLIAVAAGEEAKPAQPPPKYFPAQHGYNGGLKGLVDLSERDGFDAVRTLDEVAAFAAKVPGAIGFTAHPQFEHGKRHAQAVLWYSRRSKPELSWVLHLFDAAEAQKQPGEAVKAAALLAAERQVANMLPTAEGLIKEGGAGGVRFGAELAYEEKKLLALAVLRVGGFFAHGSEFGAECGSCRSVVPGGNPEKCAAGMLKVKHWTCCGAEAGVSHCRYWALIKAQDDVGER